MVGGDGFEPSKSETTDLQSVAFGHSAILPDGAGDWSRTNNLLITNQLLCHWATPAKCQQTANWPKKIIWKRGAVFFQTLKSLRLVPRGGIEPPTQGFSVLCSTDWATEANWRFGWGSNPRPLAWQASVLTSWTTEPYTICFGYWWVFRDSNPGPTGYEPVALTNWAKDPQILVWSGWRDSNSRPHGPKPRALPTALHPVIRDYCILL